jgi:serine/threonine-protein kinase
MGTNAKLDDLLLRWEEQRRQGRALSAEELCRDCPELLAELNWHIQALQFMDSVLQTTQEKTSLSRVPVTPDRGAAGPSASLATQARYAVLHLHARGGLGEVLLAQDEGLRREVALKRIQSPHAHNPESRSRFLAEAEITSRLEHPGIVPVYGLGQDGDGRPFYTMRFIQGETLQDALRKFHAADQPGRDPGERGVALRHLLSRFLTVCNTIAYAHSRGVVHRDLKPSNIMLGQYGETLVVDWGLVKPLAREEADRAGEEDTWLHAAAGGAQTQTGATLGTPAFMSPEQAAGQPDRIGPASDIYSLGTTLYALLTGEAPFQGSNIAAVVNQARRGVFAPPRQRKPDLPRPLEAICLKAMALKPEDRYPTALALAADVEHWLADEPTSAWREPWAVRARRWLARHRTYVTAGTAALLVAVGSMAVATVFLTAAHERERQARELAEHREREAQEQRQEAQKNFQRARKAVDDYLSQVSQHRLLNQPGLQPLRKQLLETARDYYQEFVRERALDPSVQDDLGWAYLQLAMLTRDLVSPSEAQELNRQAQEVFTTLARNHPEVPRYREGLAKTYNHAAILHGRIGQRDEAEAACLQALRLREQLAMEDPVYQMELAKTHGHLAALYYYASQMPQAEAAYRQALTLQEKLVRDNPRRPGYQSELADSHGNLGVLYYGTGQMAKAQASYEQALGLCERLVQAHPRVLDYQGQLAGSLINLGNVYDEIRADSKAEAAYERARTILEKLQRENPTVLDYQRDLARVYNNLGALAANTDQPEKALATHRQALALWEKLSREHPHVSEYALPLGASYCNIGHILKDSGQSGEALQHYEKAVGTLGAVLQRQPRHPEARQFLVSTLQGRGVLLTQLGRHAEALRDWERALETDPGQRREQLQLARAATFAHLGDHVRATTEANALTDPGAASGDTLYRAARIYALAAAAARRDAQLPEAERDPLAGRYGERAVELLAKARTAGHFQTPANRARLANDTDLDSLRSRDDFQQMLRELKAQDK